LGLDLPVRSDCGETMQTPPRDKQTPSGIVILGMHRSMTSLMAGLLEASGVFVGNASDLLPPEDQNARGFWERWDVVRLNEWVLKSRQHFTVSEERWTGWLHNREIHPEDLSEAEWLHFEVRARDILSKISGARKPWLIKDPRLSLTWPLWAKIWGPVLPVLVYRHPFQVARSLHKRDGIPMQVGMAMWELYNLLAIRSCQGQPHLYISSDELQESPLRAVNRILEVCKQQMPPGLPPPDPLTLSEIFQPQLVHHRGEPLADAAVPPSVRHVHRILQEGRGELPELAPMSRISLDDYQVQLAEREGLLQEIFELRSDLHQEKQARTRDSALLSELADAAEREEAQFHEFTASLFYRIYRGGRRMLAGIFPKYPWHEPGGQLPALRLEVKSKRRDIQMSMGLGRMINRLLLYRDAPPLSDLEKRIDAHQADPGLDVRIGPPPQTESPGADNYPGDWVVSLQKGELLLPPADYPDFKGWIEELNRLGYTHADVDLYSVGPCGESLARGLPFWLWHAEPAKVPMKIAALFVPPKSIPRIAPNSARLYRFPLNSQRAHEISALNLKFYTKKNEALYEFLVAR